MAHGIILLVVLLTICQAKLIFKPLSLECNVQEIEGALTCQLHNITLIPDTTNYVISTSNEVLYDHHIKSVLMQESDIYSIPNQIFEKFVNLKILYGDSSNLHVLTEESFTGAHNLQKLYLEHNNISEIPANTFKNTTQLTRLRLGFNQITHLNNFVFKNLTKLMILALNDNLLQKVNFKIFQDLTDLEFLYLEYNQIKEIQVETFQNNKVLKFLFLRNNECIDEDFVNRTEDHHLIYLKCEETVVEVINESKDKESDRGGLYFFYILLFGMLVISLVFGMFYWTYKFVLQ